MPPKKQKNASWPWIDMSTVWPVAPALTVGELALLARRVAYDRLNPLRGGVHRAQPRGAEGVDAWEELAASSRVLPEQQLSELPPRALSFLVALIGVLAGPTASSEETDASVASLCGMGPRATVEQVLERSLPDYVVRFYRRDRLARAQVAQYPQLQHFLQHSTAGHAARALLLGNGCSVINPVAVGQDIDAFLAANPVPEAPPPAAAATTGDDVSQLYPLHLYPTLEAATTTDNNWNRISRVLRLELIELAESVTCEDRKVGDDWKQKLCEDLSNEVNTFGYRPVLRALYAERRRLDEADDNAVNMRKRARGAALA